MQRSISKAMIAAAALLMGGCTLQTTLPPVNAYRIKPIEVAPYGSRNACSEKTLRVSLTLAPDFFKSPQIHYADENFEEYDYTRSRWAESPDRQLRHLFESALAQSGLFGSVITYDSQAYNDLLFEPKINDFMQYFERDGSAYVHVDMELVLMDQESNLVIATRHINKRRVTESADAIGAVKGFNAIVHETLNETTGWLDDLCKQESFPKEIRGQ